MTQTEWQILYSVFAQSHNGIGFGGSLRKKQYSCLPLGLYNASVNWISIV